MYFRILSIVLLILMIPTLGHAATTRYVRTDGGNGTQCDGLADHAYPPVSGTACALNSPFWVLPAAGESTTRAAQAGDTVVIESGSYRSGCQNSSTCRDSNVNLVSGTCSSGAPQACSLGVIPNNTTVIGCTTTGCGCTYNLSTRQTVCTSSRPELWGAGHVPQVLSVHNASGFTLSDLEITDHQTCGSANPYNCGSASTTSLNATNGIDQIGANSGTFKNLNVHGLANTGFKGGYVGALTYDNVNIAYNGLAGIDYDSCNNNGTCGTTALMTFKNHTTIQYSGCVENYPSVGTMPSGACADQNNSGYGDGMGGTGSGGTWVFTDVDVSHNMSDGIDLKYINQNSYTGGSLNIKRSRFEGNIGQQVKGDFNTTIEDSVIAGNIGYFFGKAFTDPAVGYNRGGATVLFAWNTGSGSGSPLVINSTVTSNNDVMFTTAGGCGSGKTITVRNSLLLGGTDFTGGDQVDLNFYDQGNGACTPSFVEDHNTCSDNFKSNKCVAGTDSVTPFSNTYAGNIQQGNGATFTTTGYYTGTSYIDELTLKSTSAARNAANTAFGDSLDYNSFNRGVSWDEGAIEFGSTVSGGATCGNNIKESGEVCDGSDLNSQTCVTQGFTSGSLSCAGNCLSFNTASCTTNLCGNGNIDGSEQCDGSNLNGQTCASQGFSSGTLACSGSCTFNTASCAALACPNGVIDSGEQCDDNNSTNLDGCSSRCEIEGLGLEQFLTYTLGNPSSYFDVHTNRLVEANVQTNSNTYLRKDFGAAHFGDFTHDFTVQINNCTDDGHGNRGGSGLWAMSASPYTDMSALENAADGLDFSLSCLSNAAQYTWQLYSAEGATAVATYNDIIPTITRYVRIQRIGTALTAKLYTDAAHTNLLHTLSITVPATTYRYLYPGIVYNSATTGMSYSGEIQNLNLVAGTVLTPTTYGTKLSGCTCYGTALK